MGKESHREKRRKHKATRVRARRHPVVYRTWDPPARGEPFEHDFFCQNNIIGILHKWAHYACLFIGGDLPKEQSREAESLSNWFTAQLMRDRQRGAL